MSCQTLTFDYVHFLGNNDFDPSISLPTILFPQRDRNWKGRLLQPLALVSREQIFWYKYMVEKMLVFSSSVDKTFSPFFCSHLLLVINSSTNMVLYIFLNKAFRLHFVTMLKRFIFLLGFPCHKKVRPDTISKKNSERKNIKAGLSALVTLYADSRNITRGCPVAELFEHYRPRMSRLWI